MLQCIKVDRLVIEALSLRSIEQTLTHARLVLTGTTMSLVSALSALLLYRTSHIISKMTPAPGAVVIYEIGLAQE